MTLRKADGRDQRVTRLQGDRRIGAHRGAEIGRVVEARIETALAVGGWEIEDRAIFIRRSSGWRGIDGGDGHRANHVVIASRELSDGHGLAESPRDAILCD